MPTYLWECEECDSTVRVHRSIGDYLQPPSEGECEPCNRDEGHGWRKILETPKVLKASYVSGQRMKTDQSYSEYAKALEIDTQLPNYRRNSDEYKEMKKESNKLKGRDTGEASRSAATSKPRKGT
jgi:predicted nucleic acid-binding Zn ribbon protein